MKNIMVFAALVTLITTSGFTCSKHVPKAEIEKTDSVELKNEPAPQDQMTSETDPSKKISEDASAIKK